MKSKKKIEDKTEDVKGSEVGEKVEEKEVDEGNVGEKVDEGLDHELKPSKDPNFMVVRVWNFPHTVYFDYKISYQGIIQDLMTLISEQGFKMPISEQVLVY